MRKTNVVLLACTLLSITFSGCRQVEPDPTPTPLPTPIIPEKPTYVVRRGTVVSQLDFLARATPLVEERIFFRMDGYVKAVHVKRNDTVSAGQLLAELDVEDLHKQLAQAQVALDTVMVQLEEAKRQNEEQLEEARINLQKAELRLAKVRTQDPAPSVSIAKTRLEQAEAGVRLAQAAYDRRASRPGVDASPEAINLQQATQDREIAQSQYDQALQDQEAYKYDVQLLELDVDLANLALERLESGVDPQLLKEVETRQLSLDRLQAQVASAQIVSPIDGTVTSISVYAGRPATAFQPVVVVADTTDLELAANLTSTQLEGMSEGMECTILLSNRPGEEWQGQIRLLPYPYGSGGGTAALAGEDTSTRVSYDTTALELEAGDLTKVVVTLESREDVLYLPPEAIRTFEGRKFVVVQEGEGQRRVDVQLGLKTQDRVEIEAGLEEGQIIIGL